MLDLIRAFVMAHPITAAAILLALLATLVTAIAIGACIVTAPYMDDDGRLL